MGAEGNWPEAVDTSPWQALCFDLDGTLVDTMALHGQAYGEVFADLGHPLGMAQYLAHIGPPARIAIRLYARAAGMGEIADQTVAEIHAAKKARFRAVLARDGAAGLPASALIARHAGRLPMAVVSSGNRDGVELILRHMGWREALAAVVSGDDTLRGKPAPDPYLLGAERLGVAPGRCLAFEDTETGIGSALAAGMAVVDVTRPGRILRPDRDAPR
ncbi:HAD family hydrolase [Pseudogemmobacter sonorensis]|uniref:HAD family hydrolase n=1 Tax=Pseudogemmobacter sonorensis TaxID=2989681 RepID=UPI0036AFFFEF